MESLELHLERLPKSIELVRADGAVSFRYIDERLLPGELRICKTSDWRDVVRAIRELAVRGAPALGISGAAAIALWAASARDVDGISEVAETVASARPTAVNLRWGVERALATVRMALDGDRGAGETPVGEGSPLSDALCRLVWEMQDEDERINRAIGANGAALLRPGSRILTHCNAGSLATYFYGTALGVVYSGAAQGKVERVYADETRPVGQGARLTAWELSRVGVPVTLICDNMAATLMASGLVDAVIVGADRIARNGDTANKIGTYGVAVLAHEHGVPFYVAAPTSTIDPSMANGSGIVIEQRSPDEVLPNPIQGVEVLNPAFDVTPARYISKIITETGVYDPSEL